LLAGAVGQELQLLEINRLLQVVEGAQLHRLDRAFDRAMGGHDDHRHRRVEFADPAQQVDAAHPGQAHVGEDHVRPQLLEHAERTLGVSGNLGLVPRLGKESPNRARERPLVIHDENAWSAHAPLPAATPPASATGR
jgi:hypothetical protein